MKRIFLLTALSLALQASAFGAEITWLGGSDSDWNNPFNWDLFQVPMASDTVIISSTGSSVVFSGTSTVTRVYVTSNSQLTIEAGATLTIDGASTDDALETGSTGTIINNGNIIITNATGNDIDGLYNKGTFTNGGSISINGAGEHGLRTSGGTFTNNGSISITNVGQADSNADNIYLDDDSSTGPSTLANNGTITIVMTSGDHGIYAKDFSKFDNSSTVIISSTGGDDGIAMETNGIFNNLSSGIVNINSSNDEGVVVRKGGVFNNNSGSTLNITGVPSQYILVDNDGGTAGTFNNSGAINISGSGGDDGILVDDASTFNNNSFGIVSISGIPNQGVVLKLSGIFNNNAGSLLDINSTGSDNIWLDATSAFNNMGAIDLDGSSNLGLYVTDASVLTNSGTIEIDGSTNYSMQVDANQQGGSVLNDGTITITGGVNDGLRMQEGASFTNNGSLILVSTGDEGIQIDDATPTSTFNNNGTVEITGAVDHGMELFGTFNNFSGATYIANDCGDDGLRMRNSGVFNNYSAFRSNNCNSDGIETDGASFNNFAGANFAPGASPGELEIRDDFDLGESTVTFEITGTTHTTEFDRIEFTNLGDLTVTNATMHIDWGSYIPAAGAKFKVIDGSTSNPGNVVGTFSNVTSSNPDIPFTVDYTGTTEVEIEVSASFPVRYAKFEGKKTERGSELMWQTASEVNNEVFEIERSSDSNSWNTIGQVKGEGNSKELVEYIYLDENPMSGTNYYRLKQIDYDGNYDYSSTIAVEADKARGTTVIYPNPVRETLYIDNTDQESQQIELYDSSGRLILSNSSAAGQISFAQYDSGLYFLHVISPTDRTVHKIFHK